MPWLIRELFARHKITIINYHNPSPEIFSRHMSLFSQLYSFISIDQLTAALKSKDFSSLPPKSLLVTIDDGYADNYRLLAIISSLSIPVAIYVVAGVVDTNRRCWFDLFPHSGETMRYLKSLTDTQRRQWLKLHLNHSDEKEYNSPSLLSAQQLHTLLKAGCTIGSHSLFHPLLDKCSERVGLNECKTSKVLLERFLHTDIIHFALPNGNGNNNVRRWIVTSGYLTCRTTTPGWVTQNSDLLLLPTFGIDDNANSFKARLQACGIWWFLKPLLSHLT